MQLKENTTNFYREYKRKKKKKSDIIMLDPIHKRIVGPIQTGSHQLKPQDPELECSCKMSDKILAMWSIVPNISDVK